MNSSNRHRPLRTGGLRRLRHLLPVLPMMLLTLAVRPVAAQTEEEAAGEVRPGGVGVVMSGGGAKGLYHIGVLEALEEYSVPIDYVAGTSMGSIIAAMYAAGYSPAEMRQIVASGAVKEWVSGRIDPNRYLPYYRQYGQHPALIDVRLDFRKGSRTFRSPTSLLSSTPVDLALTGLFAPASAACEGDFNRLMVPFLCVASDMAARQPAVLRSGSLSEAVRSSMSIPLVFKAIKRDSMLLYDGGIYDNFPWKPLDRHFRPEFIIGSVCTSGNTVPSEQNGLLDQAFLLAMQETDYSLPAGRSICISRAVDVNMLDFDRAVQIMDAGYTDALALMPQILEQVVRRQTPAESAARRQAFRTRCAPLIFDDYRIEGLTEPQTEYVRDFMQVERKATGRPRTMGFDRLRTHLYEVLAGGDFTMDFPEAVYDSLNRRYTFAARFQTKPNFILSIGGNISSTAFNVGYLGATYHSIGRVAQSLHADLFPGPICNWGSFGGRTDFYLRYPLFLDYAFNFNVRNLNHGYFGCLTDVDNTQEIKESDVFGSLALGVPISQRSLVLLRANGGHANYHFDADGSEETPKDHNRFTYFGLMAAIERNTLDHFVYPSKGSSLRLSGIFITGAERFESGNRGGFGAATRHHWFGARLQWSRYLSSPQSWFSIGLQAEALWSDLPDFNRPGATLLAMPAYAPIDHAKMIYMPDFRAKRYLAAGVMPTFHLLPNCFVRLGGYALCRERRSPVAGYPAGGHPEARMHYILDASFVYRTPIGPASLNLIKYDLRNRNNLYLVFNFGYAIFAPKGMFY